MQANEAKPIKIFLVDDHKTILWGLERLVESAAPNMVVVGKAASRAELFAQLPAANPDIILLDLDLNGESGLDCLHELVGQTSAQVLVLTGTSDLKVHQQAVMRGARGVIHKQESAEIILRAIEKVHQGEVWLDPATIGRVMTAMARGPAVDPEAAKIQDLTPKERQIIATLVKEKGARNKVLADKLHVSEHTLRNQLTTIYSKLEVSGRLELYLYGTSHHVAQMTH